MKKLLGALAIAGCLIGCGDAVAQTVPSWMIYGAVPTAAQWQAFAASKQDYAGSASCGVSGCTFTGEIITAPSTASSAGLNVPAGTAPTTPNNGDIWSTVNGFYGQYNGVTVGPVNRLLTNTIEISVTGVNFNSAATDNAIAIPTLPSGYTRYQVGTVMISNASHSLTTATFGLFTSTGGSGTVIASTAITVSSSTDGASNNFQSTSGPTTVSFTQAGFGTLYFRVINAEGTAATGTVTLRLIMVP